MKQSSKIADDKTIGIDLGDRESDVCVLGATGEVLNQQKVATTESGLGRIAKKHPGARIVIEVSAQSPWVSRYLEGLGHGVIVANPARVRRIAANEDKTDRIDAELLARLGRADPKLLRPIRHRGEQVQRDRALLRVRDGLVRSRSSLVTQARCIAKSLGKRLPSCDAQNFAKRMDREELRGLFPGLEVVVGAVGELSARIKALDREIEGMCRERYPETSRFRQIVGVGPITALSYAVTIEDPRRFTRSRSVGAYLGLKPRKHQSGDADPQLRITKTGDPFVRRTLVQAAHYILGYRGPDTALRRFGERLMRRGGSAARKRAAVAVARKLAVLMHRLWITGARYEPLRGLPVAAS